MGNSGGKELPIPDRRESYKTKISRLQQSLADEGLDGIVCFKPQNTFFLIGFSPIMYSHPVIVILPVKGQPVFLVHCLRASHAAAEAVTEDVRLFGAWGQHKPIAYDPYDAIGLVLEDLGLKGTRLGYEADFMPCGAFQRLQAVSGGREIKDIAPLMQRARMIKDGYELAMLRLAARLADIGMQAAVSNVRRSEIEASAAAEAAMRQYWSRELGDYEVSSFGGSESGIVNALACYSLSGSRVTFGVECPKARLPEPGEIALSVVWSACGGYHAENERSVIIERLDPQHMRAYEAMLEARKRALDALRPGAVCREVYEASVSAFREAGFGGELPGRIGHGIGLGVHESPSLGSKDSVVLTEGMAFTVEPGLVFPGWGSVRHSDTAIVMSEGVELLTVTPEAGKIIR